MAVSTVLAVAGRHKHGFLLTGVLTAFSPVAVRIADRFGLVNTMVFYASAGQSVPDPDSVHARRQLRHCVAVCQSALSQMDVPTSKLVRDGHRVSGRAAGRRA
jgi:hypothetical protein